MEKTGSKRLSPVSVYLVAENRLLREALVRLFQKRSDISVVGEGRHSDSNAERIAESKCDVLLTDSLTTVEALDLVEDLGEDLSQLKLILFGMNDDPDFFLRAASMGIRGYLLKDASSAEVISAILGVVQGESVCPPRLCRSLFEFVSQEFRRRSGIVDQQACSKLGLTFRQRQLVNLVAKGLTNKEIAAKLNLSEFTVKNHIHRIMRQVDADTRYDAVDVIRANGFLPSA
jgi:DNA-binding NarL/FixJ family response regulator